MGFFSELERPLEQYLDGLKREHATDDSDVRKRLLIGAVGAILESPEDYDQHAQLTKQWVGSSFRTSIVNKDFSDAALDRTLSTVARFIREVTIRRSSYTALESEILDYFVNPSRELKGDDLNQADYIRNGLPISVMKDLLDKLSLAEKSSEAAREKLFQGTRELEERIAAHQGELKKIETGYNFVGLTAAFKSLLGTKSREKWVAFIAVITLGILAIGIPVVILALRFNSDASSFGDSWSPTAAASLVAIAGVEIIALYFFRVSLRNYQVSRSQITSLQLRSALCAFIEGYLEFRSRVGGKDPAALAGFEQLIFAGLPDSADGMPSTLDGLAQVADIVRAARSA